MVAAETIRYTQADTSVIQIHHQMKLLVEQAVIYYTEPTEMTQFLEMMKLMMVIIRHYHLIGIPYMVMVEMTSYMAETTVIPYMVVVGAILLSVVKIMIYWLEVK